MVPAYFAFGLDLAEVASGVPGILDDHQWIWTTDQRAVAVPRAGRRIHGVISERPPAEPRGVEPVERVVRVGSGRAVTALVVVDAAAVPAIPVRTFVERIIGAARRLQLPDECVSQLAVWARAGRHANGADDPRTLTELLRTPGVHEVVVRRSRFGFLALHGGDLEGRTDVIAEQAAELAGASYYGAIHPVGHLGHLPSARYDPTESRALRDFLGHVERVISIHGYGRRDRRMEILLGGRDRALARQAGAELQAALPGYRIVTDVQQIPPELRGQHPDNPVNRPPGGGVQLELPAHIRGMSPLGPGPDADGLVADTRVLIAALAALARPRAAVNR
jgi:phage replication-related protein YjqB (UPF0714/DUF867 family)